ncbi:uncharacterized protein [Antennarius striatus]|uniref:uncharacterized protein n=1 Tax=Antennarius striatus TaxID=241820 RepID=UPI0035ADE380
MSIIVQTRGEAGGGVAAHLQCPFCGHFSRSHAHLLSHIAASHPASLDDVTVGRLGNILLYQSSAQLFHCFDCFFTSRDFAKLFKHIISKHCVDEKDGGGGGDDHGGEEKEGVREEVTEEKDGGGEAIKEEEEEKEVGHEVLKSDVKQEGCGEDDAPQTVEPAEADGRRDDVELSSERGNYCCLICGWKGKLKNLGINHVMQKHDIPKTYAAQAIKRYAVTPKQTQSSGPEEDEETGLSGEMLREEMEATAKVIRFASSRFICVICGWKTKLKGFAISHVVGCHDVERPYSCKDCQCSFFLPSRLQQHISTAHRPGRYACPFCCCFRSHYLGGFRRHCSRCNARVGPDLDQLQDQLRAGGETEKRVVRKRRRTVKVIKEEEEEEALLL